MSDPDYYRKCCEKYIPKDASVLVVCGGWLDKDVFEKSGYQNVTISNLDSEQVSNAFAPFRWASADAENLAFEDDAFDYVVAHAGIHHCASPHRAILEMYRVARKGALIVESRDSLVVRLLVRLGLVADYELEAIARNELRYGGWRNSEIPNFVYRWTEREVEKTVRSFDPKRRTSLKFEYGYKVPTRRLEDFKNAHLVLAAKVLGVFAAAFFAVFPKQGNNFAFLIAKDVPFQPWLTSAGALDAEYIRSRFKVWDRGRRSHVA